MLRWVWRCVLSAALVFGLLWVPNGIVALLRNGPSVCTGTTSNGGLVNARRINDGSYSGRAARPYCWICARLLRTYSHSKVTKVVGRTYLGFYYDGSDTDWVYGEAAWPWGGSFYPHRTHQNGMSVDFMVPLKDAARFPTHPLNRFGYGEEFNSDGIGSAGQIDFLAMAQHLNSLDRHARHEGGSIRRVILAPDLQDDLFESLLGAKLRKTLTFNTRQAWVRHDDHYRVDFDFPCEPK